jgi:hypothetical protein
VCGLNLTRAFRVRFVATLPADLRVEVVKVESTTAGACEKASADPDSTIKDWKLTQ